MLAKLKRLDQYVNHGVWGYFIKNETYPVKRKILEVIGSVSKNDISVLQAFIENVGWYCPEDLYMTKTEVLQSSRYLERLELQLKSCNNTIVNYIDTIADKKKELAKAEQNKERLSKFIATLKAKVKQNAD